MNTLKAAALAAFLSSLLLACAQEEDPEGVIPQGYEDAVEKAQGVGDKLQESLDGRGEEQQE